MELTFTSPSGSFTADGGGGKSPLKIRNFEGLGLPAKNFNTTSYPNQNGRITVSKSFDARTITLGLDLLMTGEAAAEFESGMLAAASEDGVLKIGDREIDCFVASISPAQIHSGDYPRYAVQFICDYPLFRDQTPTVQNLFTYTNCIKPNFSFPLILSTMENKQTVINNGITAVEPVIIVGFGNNQEFTIEGMEENQKKILRVSNLTNDAQIALELDASELLHKVTIDIPNRKIYSADGELTHCLCDNIFMCDFVLEKGENQIITTFDNTEIFAQIRFYNEYLGAKIC